MSVIRAQGRLKGRKPVAVIDIGSNSVRLVVYEGLVRSPTVLFNEKILCGLGRGLAKTGKLEKTSTDFALRTLRRFRALCQQMDANEIHVLATAAAREAKNGMQFIKNAESVIGKPIAILTGKQEAELSANGVISTFYKPEGIVGDLGGGSLELIDIKNTKIGEGITLPLGGIRLQDLSNGDLAKAAQIARDNFKSSKILQKYQHQNFYAVGGTWRNLAKLYMHVQKYPLPVMHDYQIATSDLTLFLKQILQQEIDCVPGIETISKSRRQLLSYGIVVLNELITALNPKKIIFSAAGVREGYLYARLPKKIQKLDSLLSAAEEMTILRARSPKHAHELIDWTESAWKALGLVETAEEKRCRATACLLSDVDWRIHPDYRGSQASNQIAYGGYTGLDHCGRIFIALTIFFRNEGLAHEADLPPFVSLVDSKTIERAKILGAVMRIANVFCTSTAGILPSFRWKKNKAGATLIIPKIHEALIAERPIGRLQQLSRLLKVPIDYTVRK